MATHQIAVPSPTCEPFASPLSYLLTLREITDEADYATADVHSYVLADALGHLQAARAVLVHERFAAARESIDEALAEVRRDLDHVNNLMVGYESSAPDAADLIGAPANGLADVTAKFAAAAAADDETAERLFISALTDCHRLANGA